MLPEALQILMWSEALQQNHGELYYFKFLNIEDLFNTESTIT